MSKERAQVTLREIHGPYMQLLTNLQGDDGREWLDALKRFLRKEEPWKRLEVWCCVTVPEYYFEAREHLKVDTSGQAYEPVAEIFNDRFIKCFADLIDWEAGLSLPAIHRVLRSSSDSAIIAELGQNAEVELGLFWEVLHASTPEDEMDFDGYMAYVRDPGGNLWRVIANWDSRRRGWAIDAASAPGPESVWAGIQVVSK